MRFVDHSDPVVFEEIVFVVIDSVSIVMVLDSAEIVGIVAIFERIAIVTVVGCTDSDAMMNLR